MRVVRLQRLIALQRICAFDLLLLLAVDRGHLIEKSKENNLRNEWVRKEKPIKEELRQLSILVCALVVGRVYFKHKIGPKHVPENDIDEENCVAAKNKHITEVATRVPVLPEHVLDLE